MSSSQKLTKKQKKAVAFRDRIRGKSTASRKGARQDEDEDNAVPVAEDQYLADVQADCVENEEEGKTMEGGVVGQGAKRTKHKPRESTKSVVVSKKRKREDVVETKKQDTGSESQENPKAKKRRGNPGCDVGMVVDDEGGRGGEEEEGETKTKQRYILFLGNLKYTTNLEDIAAHFAACDPPPTIRLLTPKPSSTKSSSNTKSKGCAFLEFKHRNALQQGLKLHHTQLDGRQINVELTAGGGGKSTNRLEKVKERNKELNAQRQKRSEKQAKADESQTTFETGGPKRYSTTSGVDQTPAKKRTWTVGETVETENHRGGKKHAKSRKSAVKDWSSGANAIPVG